MGAFDLQRVRNYLTRMCPSIRVVKGSYPRKLLQMWDEFEHSREDCDGARPSSLPATQLYCVVILPHAGTDLESYHFQGKMVWREACQVFWQVAKALKVAEEAASFEVCKQHSVPHKFLITFCPSIAICTGVRSFCKRRSSQQPK